MVEIFHHTSIGGKHLAFLYLGVPVPGERIVSQRARLLDGRVPLRGMPMHCGSCGDRVECRELTWT